MQIKSGKKENDFWKLVGKGGAVSGFGRTLSPLENAFIIIVTIASKEDTMPKELSHHRLHLFMAMFILISFMLGCNEYMVVGNLTLIAQTYHESLSQVSSLVAIFAWTYAIVTPILAIFTNRIHKYYLLMGLLVVAGMVEVLLLGIA